MSRLSLFRLPLLLAAVACFFIPPVSGQAPPGYYDPAAGKSGVALQAALHDIIDNHTVISYTGIMGYFPVTDAKPGSVVWDMYSDVPGGTPPYVFHYNTGDECGNYSKEGDCYNREHSWPQSWFNEASPMKSDMFHIYPTDGYVNGKRSNYPYGTVASPSWTSRNGSKLGPCTWPGYSGTVFEPLDEYKGDFARTYFYMSTRYYSEDAGWDVTDMTNKSQLKPWALQMMLHWHNTDPVSTKEISRNNALYGIQNNRNPFIDHPEFAAQIWGNPVGTDEPAALHTLAVRPNPVMDFCRVSLPAAAIREGYEVNVLSVGARQVNVPYVTEGQEIVLDMRSLEAGLYILQVRGNNALFYARILKAC